MPGDPSVTPLERGNRWVKLILYAAMLLMLAALAVYAYLGFFTRYMADDYCSLSALRQAGFWGAQVQWWQDWSGRYSFSFVITLVELFGVGIVPLLPALAIALWLFSMVWAYRPLFQGLKNSSYIPAGIFVASAALWITYRSIADYPQIVFWQTGILTYPVSLILFFLGSGVALRRSNNPARVRWLELLAWFLFAFLAGGFSETGVVTQIVVLAFLLMLFILTRNGKREILAPILLASLSGSILSLFVIALAPGNQVRSGGFQNIPPLAQSLPGSLAQTLQFIPNFIDQHTILFLFGLVAGAFFVYFGIAEGLEMNNRSLAWHFLGSFVLAEIGIWAGIAPAYLLRGGMPPERVLLFANFLAACLAIYWGGLSALLLRSNLPQRTSAAQSWISLALLAFMFVWGVAPHMVSQLKLAAPLREYSRQWDARHQTLLFASAPGEPIVVQDFTRTEDFREISSRLWLTGDFETSPDHWVNRCAAIYYGVDQIIAE